MMYHFTAKTLRNGDPIPPIGEWLRWDGPVVMCESGLHASPTPFAALQYAPGEFLHQVELRGDLIEEPNDKSVGRERRIIASIDATDVLRQFARHCALSVIHLWDAPTIVREYLETGDESKRDAAWAAGWAAERDAAWAAGWAAERAAGWAAERDAGWAAGWAAARAAARDATWAAARAAAWAAARDATREKYALRFDAMVEQEFARL